MRSSSTPAFVLPGPLHLKRSLASRIPPRFRCHVTRCEVKTPSNLTPLLEAARDKLRPLGLHVPSLTWHRPVLTVYLSRESTAGTVTDTNATGMENNSEMTENFGVSADDCAEATILLNALLDNPELGAEETDPTTNTYTSSATSLFPEQSYTLEVSSIGASEELQSPREFAAFRGFPVRVTCAPRRKKKSGAGQLDDATKNLKDNEPQVILGRLGTVTDDSITVNVKGRSTKIVRSDLFDVKLVTAPEIGEQGE